MSCVRTITALLLTAAAALIGAAPASAALYTWDTTGTLNPGSGTACAGGVACKTTFISTSGGVTLAARAYSTPVYDTTSPYDVSGKWLEAQIATYSGGIGVKNLVAGDTVSEGSSPEHAVDNEGVRDLVVFELPTGVWDPEALKLGWSSIDSDVQAWVGGGNLAAGYDFRNVCFSVGSSSCTTTLASLGFADVSASMPAVSCGIASPGGTSAAGGVNMPTNCAVPFNTTQTGRYLVVSGNLGLDTITGNNDFFKINQFSARVPVPGSPLLLALGLIALAHVRARPRRASPA